MGCQAIGDKANGTRDKGEGDLISHKNLIAHMREGHPNCIYKAVIKGNYKLK
jgi:hypothetical protein